MSMPINSSEMSSQYSELFKLFDEPSIREVLRKLDDEKIAELIGKIKSKLLMILSVGKPSIDMINGLIALLGQLGELGVDVGELIDKLHKLKIKLRDNPDLIKRNDTLNLVRMVLSEIMGAILALSFDI